MRHTLLCPHGCEVNPSHLVQKSTIVSICLPVVYRYDHFKLYLDRNQGRYITSFYTDDGGYNLCLLIFPNGLKWDGWMSVTEAHSEFCIPYIMCLCVYPPSVIFLIIIVHIISYSTFTSITVIPVMCTH